MKNKTDRNDAIDFLRILCMFFIIIHHILGHGGILKNSNGMNYWILWFMEISVICAVNCYILITGYLGININFRYSKIFKLWVQVFFYSSVISIIFMIFFPTYVSKKQIVMSFFPVIGDNYWYFTKYFGLYLLIPFINTLIKSITKAQFKVLIGTLISFCILSIVSTNDLFNINNGYSITWFIIMYLIGSYIRIYANHEKCEKKSKNKFLYLYTACIIVTWGSKVLIEYVTIKVFGEPKATGILVNYISPTIVLAAVFLFLSCYKYKFTNKYILMMIRIFAPISFIVYLIHDNNLIRNYFIKDSFSNISETTIILLIFIVIISAVFIFIICSILEYLRLLIFRILNINKIINYIEQKIINIEFKIQKVLVRE